MMILSMLTTEKEAKELLNDESLALLVGYFGKCVRKELPAPKYMLVNKRCTWIIQTLEKMITSDEHIVEKLLKLDLLTFLEKVLDESFCEVETNRADEISAALTCLWSLSQDFDALLHISRNGLIVMGMLCRRQRVGRPKNLRWPYLIKIREVKIEIK